MAAADDDLNYQATTGDHTKTLNMYIYKTFPDITLLLSLRTTLYICFSFAYLFPLFMKCILVLLKLTGREGLWRPCSNILCPYGYVVSRSRCN
jgi:hypothetical protein